MEGYTFRPDTAGTIHVATKGYLTPLCGHQAMGRGEVTEAPLEAVCGRCWDTAIALETGEAPKVDLEALGMLGTAGRPGRAA